MTVHQYDIVLDVTVINRTGDTLQNLCLELATMGDLKLVERPQNYTLGPGATRTVRCARRPRGAPVPAQGEPRPAGRRGRLQAAGCRRNHTRCAQA